MGSLLLSYPLVGFMNAFFYVLKYPNIQSTRSDIALMDMVVGHFGHLGFLSAHEMAYSFPRQIVMLALTTAKKAQQQVRAHHPMGSILAVEGDNGYSSVDSCSNVCCVIAVTFFSVESSFLFRRNAVDHILTIYRS